MRAPTSSRGGHKSQVPQVNYLGGEQVMQRGLQRQREINCGHDEGLREPLETAGKEGRRAGRVEGRVITSD